MPVWLGFLLFLYLVSQEHWELLGSGILCHPLTVQECASPTVYVCGCWLLTTMYFRNIVRLYLFSISLYFLAPSEWKRIMILHLNQEEEKNSHPSFSLCVCDCVSWLATVTRLGLFAYMFVSPLDCKPWMGREEWYSILLPSFSVQPLNVAQIRGIY